MQDLLDHLTSQLVLRALLLGLGVYMAVLLAVAVDLYSGMRRSRRLGIRLRSKGIRSSIRKFNDYITLTALASCADILLCAYGLYSLPYTTLFFGVVAIANEIKSVWENTDRDRQRDIATALDGLASLARNRKEASEILSILSKRMLQGAEPQFEDGAGATATDHQGAKEPEL